MKKLRLLFLLLFISGLLSTEALVAATIYSAGNLTGGSVTSAGVRTGGGLWTATTTWAGGVVPLTTDNAVIVAGDLVYNTATSTVASLTINGSFCQGNSVTGTATFTMASGATWYAAYSSATKLPQGFTSYSIDPNSNWVICSNSSSTLINASPAIYGNLTVYKGGSILAGTTGLTNPLTSDNINILGNLIVDCGSGSAVKGANTKSDAATIIHVGGSVTIKTGILSGVDAVVQTTICTYNIDGNVNVGDGSTASGLAALAPVSAADAGYQRTGIFNITGNLSYINGAKFEAGSNGTGTNTSELCAINLKGNLSTDVTVAIANNTKGTFVVSLVGTGAQTITLGLKLSFSPATLFALKVNKSSGDVTLNSADSINGTLNLTSGKLILSGYNLLATTISGGSSSSYIVFDAAGTGSVALNVPASTSTLPIPVGTAVNYTPLSLQYPVAPTAGVITLSKVTPDMNIIHLVSILNDGGYSLERRSSQYWSYTNTATGSSYNLSIDGSSGQLGINDPSNLRIIHSPDGTTFDLVGTHASGSGTIANRTSIPDGTSGRFYLGGQDDSNNPLPVELSSFTSNVNGRNIQLNWETKTEKNSNRFEIERSLVGTLNWAVVGNVQAAVLSNSPKQYSYTDTKLQSGKYQYRLKMVDNNGSFAYSSVEAAEVAVPKDFSLSQNYPNPFNPTTKIDYQVPVDAKVIMEVYNIAGQKVMELVNQQMSAGYYTVNFGTSKLSSGVYIYRISANDLATGRNFSSIKKMMVLK
ncbi:MAG: T9SS type A sorting domain-containing protein [Ignavibacteriaceae bacterium]|nr:T9SS type A sorting domain-containing protein [Ignavibacteriaceae bacterium]